MKPRILINSLSQKIGQKVSKILTSSDGNKFEIRKKEDRSVVTNIDEEISNLVKTETLNLFDEKYNFFCEEDHGELSYPAVVLDPIDGTKGLVTGTYECAVSLAIMETGAIDSGFGWIFNPFTGFSLASDDISLALEQKLVAPFLGLVSRSEWDKGIFNNLELENIILAPMGSIAFKLGLLAVGSCHFILSANPKNIWDIAAGSILCRQRGILLFNQEGKEIVHLNDKLIKGPIFWSRPELAPKIVALIKQRQSNGI
jgi:myo-inositol-1(or 4)-monophosphatase